MNDVRLRIRAILAALVLTLVALPAWAEEVEGEEAGDAPEEETAEEADAPESAAEQAPEEDEEAEEEEAETAEEAPALPTAPVETPPAEAFRPAMEERTAPRTFETYSAENGGAATAPSRSGDTGQDWRRISEAELLEPSATFPSLEWHGSFRFRTNAYWNLALGTQGTSPILPPVQSIVAPDRADGSFESFPESASGDSTGAFHNRGATRVGGANMRMRLRPTIHIAEDLRLHLEMDALDNVVLGQSPTTNFGGPASQTTQGQTGYLSSDSVIVVRQAYGEVQTFAGRLTLGRQASHWGLGILDHGGGGWSNIREPRTSYRGVPLAGHTCLDCDFGTYVDRAQFRMNLFDTYFALSWDYNDAGMTDAMLGAPRAIGQPRQLGSFDTTRSITLQVYQRPERPMEIAARNRQLKELRQGALDWGLYVQNRRQTLEATEDGWVGRDMTLWIPDLWIRYTREPAFRRRIRVELEAVAVLGTIGNVNPAVATGSDDGTQIVERDVQQFGAALEFEYQNRAMTTGLNSGFATGRDTDSEGAPYFGINDGTVLPGGENSLTAFAFHPSYMVDMIMFREIIGTVTNATYFNPFLAYDFFAKQEDVFGLRLDVIAALAVEDSVTPSGDGFYGVETDLQLYYREPRYGADITFGVFFPGAAFNAVTGRTRAQSWRDAFGENITPAFAEDSNAKPAAALQGRFFWAF